MVLVMSMKFIEVRCGGELSYMKFNSNLPLN